MRPVSSSPRKSQGFAIVEVLVSFAILAFGLMALAGLQIVTLRYTQGSGYRNAATLQAMSITEVMRGSRIALQAGQFNNPTGAQTDACFRSAGCTSAQMALTQYLLWQQTIAAGLPGGSGIVCVDSTPNDGTAASPQCDNVSGAPYAIKVFWADDKQGNQARFVTAVNP
jgi:type IV pilus assembly protein PilV